MNVINLENVLNVNDKFAKFCKWGLLEEAIHLYNNNPSININYLEEYSFYSACERGHLEVAKWLYEIKPTLNICAYDNYAFCSACENGNLEVVKWLYSIRKDNDIISMNNEASLRWSCLYGSLDVVKRSEEHTSEPPVTL